MAVDRIANLRERLRKGTFKFGALLEGVSTLEEPETEAVASSGLDSTEVLEIDSFVVEIDVPQFATTTIPASMSRREDLDLNPLRSVILEKPVEAVPSIPAVKITEADIAPHLFSDGRRMVEPSSSRDSNLDAVRDGRLKPAIETLHARLGVFLGEFAEACRQHNTEDAGFQLAQINQVLELFSSVDPTGDVARMLCPAIAPPDGSIWPAPAWTLLEFAESPVSGLLPEDADLTFARDIVGCACGLSVLE